MGENMTNQAFLGFMDMLDKRRFMHAHFFLPAVPRLISGRDGV
jgi:hypothetical protein